MISIIIPVYNAEHSLRRCVNNILALQFNDYELILIDDGSSDNSPSICDQYAASDSRIKVIHKANAGAAAARNTGLDAAIGEYILFCDADDCYDTKELDMFLAEVLGKSPQTVLHCFDFRNVWPSGLESTVRYPKDNIRLCSDLQKIHFTSSRAAHSIAGYSLWNKLYSKQLIDQYNIRMFERDDLNNIDDWAEDLMFNLQYYSVVNEVAACGRGAYHLTKHVSSGDESEGDVAGRVAHMLKLFDKLTQTKVFLDNEALAQNFWQIIIWHMRRFLYAEIGIGGITSLRETCLNSPHNTLFFACITEALKNWSQIANRWSKKDAQDYNYFLKYLKTGNLFLYKLNNYWLWKITPLVYRTSWRNK